MAVGNSPKITLCEDDINRASLRGKTPSQRVKEMAFLQERSEIEWNKVLSSRMVNTHEYLIFPAYFMLNTVRQTERNATVPFRVQSYIAGGLDKDLIDPDNGENIVRKRRKLGIDGGNAAATRDKFMFPPSTALWKRIADGRTLLPEFSLANIMAYFVTRRVCDGQNAADFKHLNNHSYSLFKSDHIQKILNIKGNNNNVYLNAVCLPEIRKDREYKI